MPVKTTILASEPVVVQQHELTLTTNAGTNNKEKAFSATILTYGATLTHLTCPDRWNQPQDVVLGFDHWQDYVAQAQPGALNPYFGSIIGPTASRIANATFQLESTHAHNLATTTTTATSPAQVPTHVLQVSNGLDCHHGGPKGFDKQHWTTVNVNQDETSVTLEWVSPHGDYGYPGRLVSRVQYKLTGQGELIIEFSAQLKEGGKTGGAIAQDTSSMDLHSTIVSLTNHAYWNLDGVLNPPEDQEDQFQSLFLETPPISGTATNNNDNNKVVVIKNPCTVKDHTLWLSTSTLVELGNKHPVPTGVLIDVTQTPELHIQKELLDFTGTEIHPVSRNKALGYGLDSIPGGYGYDHVFALDGTDANHTTPVPVNDVGIQAYWPRTPHVATLYSPRSGIRLDLSTSEPAVVLYAAGYLDKSLLPRTKSKILDIPGNSLATSPAAAPTFVPTVPGDERKVKIEAEFDKFAGFCLEPIRFPDAIHHRDWAGMVTLHHDQVYRQRSVYKFSSE
ncbi:hypothetical protein BG015_002701 [Linnemannia schmuckeri]|uniref:Galactose mutarotase-like protein n=1 Tax=Linnemannia schmuckeri TaxID=64567 RepID=A0A9P5V6A1_9FUNG|nr:hypothetical protein BG015_002701 [Linnemannia schmuckeri]